MEGTYDVMLGSQKMGSVTVRKQGLYWQFDCRCSLSGEVMYDLVVQTADAQVSLGLLTPCGDRFGLLTKQPVKRMEQGKPTFLLRPRHTGMKECFVRVNPQEPFGYLRRLESAYLAKRNNQIGLILEDEK